MTTTYRDIIRRIDPGVNAAGVEASMRLQHSTLDHLSEETFRDEIEIAKQCEIREPGFLKECARSYGMEAAEFEREEQRLKKAGALSGARGRIRPATRRRPPTEAQA